MKMHLNSKSNKTFSIIPIKIEKCVCVNVSVRGIIGDQMKMFAFTLKRLASLTEHKTHKSMSILPSQVVLFTSSTKSNTQTHTHTCLKQCSKWTFIFNSWIHERIQQAYNCIGNGIVMVHCRWWEWHPKSEHYEAWKISFGTKLKNIFPEKKWNYFEMRKINLYIKML